MVWWCCRGPHLCVQAPGDEQLHRLAQWPAWRKRIGALEPPALGMYLAEMYYSVGLQLQRSDATKFAGALIRLARQIYVTSCGRHATLMPFALFLHHTFPRQPTCSSAAQVETTLILVVQGSYLWAGPLAYLIKTALTAFVIVAVLRPFRAQQRRALAEERRRPTGLASSIKHMLLDKWDNIRGRQARIKEVVTMTERTADEDFPWWRSA